MKLLPTILSMIVSLTLWADEPADWTGQAAVEAPMRELFGPGMGRAGAPTAPSLVGGSMVRYVSSMALILVIFGGAWWGLRRFQKHHGGKTGHGISVVSRIPVAPRQSVVMVRVHGEDVLIGVTAERMTLLARYALLDGEDMDDTNPAMTDDQDAIHSELLPFREVNRL